MNDRNITVEGLAIKRETQLSCPIRNKEADIPDSSARRHSNGIGISNHKELSDEELVRSFVETHDEAAFNEIVGRYADKIYGLALRITRNRNDAEDVLQQVFMIFVEKLNTFNEESKFSTWLHSVASNASLTHIRAATKYKNNFSLEDYAPYGEDGALKGVEASDWSGRPDEVLVRKEVMEIIEAAVNELPEKYRTVFHLRDVEGLTNQEVAKMLGVSLPNAKARIHRTRLFLRNRLSDYFPMN